MTKAKPIASAISEETELQQESQPQDPQQQQKQSPPPPKPFSMPPLVSETLQYRLDTGIIGKNGGQRGSLTRCAQKFGTYQSKLLLASTAAMEEDDDNNSKQSQQNQLEVAQQDLIQDLNWYQLDWNKLVLQQQQFQAQRTNNSQQGQEV